MPLLGPINVEAEGPLLESTAREHPPLHTPVASTCGSRRSSATESVSAVEPQGIRYSPYLMLLAIPAAVLFWAALYWYQQQPFPVQDVGVRSQHPCRGPFRSDAASSGCSQDLQNLMMTSSSAKLATAGSRGQVDKTDHGQSPAARRPLLDDSEALSCAEYAVVYRPLDMSGEQLSQEITLAACQDRCALTDGCAHFAYYLPEGHCHLQDAFAYPTDNNLEWISGPSGCTSDERSHNIITILMYKEVCYQSDTGYYVLDMEDKPPRWARDILECQRRCRNQPSCAHFTYNSLTGTCHLESSTAVAVHNPRSGNIAGPPRCHVPKEKLLQINLQRARALCSEPGENCTGSRCCRDPGMKCYERDSRWATCKASCTKGAAPPGKAVAEAWTLLEVWQRGLQGNYPGAGPEGALGGVPWTCRELTLVEHSRGAKTQEVSVPTSKPNQTFPPTSPSRNVSRPHLPFEPAAAGACRGPADQAAWWLSGKDHFNADMLACSTRCMGTAYCVSQCVKQKRDYSGNCSSCFGETAACGAKNCIWQCMAGATSAACRGCSRAHCRSPLLTCSGLEPPPMDH